MTKVKALKDSEILENIIKALGMSKNAFSKALNYKSSMTIYNIIGDDGSKFPIPEDMERRFALYLPQVSFTYLTKGTGKILNTPDETKLQNNLLNIKKEAEPRNSLSHFDGIPNTLERIEVLLENIYEEMKKNNSK